MTTKVEKTVEVAVPLRTVYDQWTQFEEFPRFMGGVTEVTQLDDKHLRWVAEIAGIRREWTATILEQIPDEKVAWAATEGATNAGAVHFRALGPRTTSVRLVLEFEPEGVVEKVADALDVVEKQAVADLERFKAFIEDAGYAAGAWRGTIDEGAGVGTPGIEAAAGSEGDSGKAGVSVRAAVAGAAVVAAGVAAAASVLKGGADDAGDDEVAGAGAVVEPEVAVEAPLSAEDLTAPTTDLGVIAAPSGGTAPVPPGAQPSDGPADRA